MDAFRIKDRDGVEFSLTVGERTWELLAELGRDGSTNGPVFGFTVEDVIALRDWLLERYPVHAELIAPPAARKLIVTAGSARAEFPHGRTVIDDGAGAKVEITRELDGYEIVSILRAMMPPGEDDRAGANAVLVQQLGELFGRHDAPPADLLVSVKALFQRVRGAEIRAGDVVDGGAVSALRGLYEGLLLKWQDLASSDERRSPEEILTWAARAIDQRDENDAAATALAKRVTAMRRELLELRAQFLDSKDEPTSAHFTESASVAIVKRIDTALSATE